MQWKDVTWLEIDGIDQKFENREESAQSYSLSQIWTFLWYDLEEQKHLWPNLTKLNNCGGGADRFVG